jgi:hypothetical protein
VQQLCAHPQKVSPRILLVAVALILLGIAIVRPHGSPSQGPYHADSARTPGVLNPDVTQRNINSTICVHGWTKTIRPPTSDTNARKEEQMRNTAWRPDLRYQRITDSPCSAGIRRSAQSLARAATRAGGRERPEQQSLLGRTDTRKRTVEGIRAQAFGRVNVKLLGDWNWYLPPARDSV